MHGHDADLVAVALLEVALDLALAGPDPMQEALQRGRLGAAVSQCLDQELVDRVVCLVARAVRRSGAARHRGPSTSANSSKTGSEVGPSEQIRQSPLRRGERRGRIAGRSGGQTLPDAQVAAPGGEREELILVKADQRALQQRRQVEVVFRQQQECAERQQILDRELLGEAHAVDAGDGHVARLQRLDHFTRSSAPRRRTRIMMSPARIGRSRASSRSPLLSQPSMVAAIASASLASSDSDTP